MDYLPVLYLNVFFLTVGSSLTRLYLTSLKLSICSERNKSNFQVFRDFNLKALLI
jgi:hypothetical protein